MRKNGNWGIKSAKVKSEHVKPNTEKSIVRVRTIETNDDQEFVDIRNWYNKGDEDDYPNMGKGIWIDKDPEMLKEIAYSLFAVAEEEGFKALKDRFWEMHKILFPGEYGLGEDDAMTDEEAFEKLGKLVEEALQLSRKW